MLSLLCQDAARRGTRLAVACLVLLLAILPGCATQSPQAAGRGDVEVTLRLANAGDEPLRCAILFGHWVEQDLGRVPPGDTLDVVLRRQSPDGGLFVPRGADGRPMMVENLICGPLAGWWEGRADVTLLPLRAGRDLRYDATCAVATEARCRAPVAR